MFSGSLKFPSKADNMLRHYKSFPHLSSYKPHTASTVEFRKIYLELSLGSLEEVWVAVLNITGPLSNWSFADNQLAAPERARGGPASHICRLSGRSHQNWTFWLEANSSEPLRVDVAVLDQYMVPDLKILKSLFPKWVDVTAYSRVMLTIGLKSTMQFFMKRQNYKGTISFGIGFFLVLIGWPIMGMILEAYGLFVLFRIR